MKPTEYTCYGCKGGGGEPLRVLVFGVLKSCPECSRTFHPRGKTTCDECKAPLDGTDGKCYSCKEKSNHG